MFYHFSQNNSGGSFDFDEARGLTHHVVIEATDCSNANDCAEDIGIYFNGVRSGSDCACCGDRWYSAEQCDAEEFPHIYSGTIDNLINSKGFHRWMPSDKEVCVHYLDGRKEWY